MNKKIVTLILVILISFSFLTIVVADNATHDDSNSTDDGDTIDNDQTNDDDDHVDKNKTTDKNKTSDKDKTNDKSKKNYVLAKGSGNDIKFSDGFRGFRLDYSKHAASSGDKFKPVSSSKAHHSNTLKLAITECYKLDSTDKIGKIMSEFIKTGSSNSKVGKAVAESHGKVNNPVKINNHTEAVFEFEVLKSVSGNESNYFAYKVSYRHINDGAKVINQTTNNLTNVTNTTNITSVNNIINTTHSTDNGTNATFLNGNDYFALLGNELFDAWKPILDMLINDYLMIANALEEIADFFKDFMMELHSLMDALEELLEMLGSIWAGLAGLLKLFEFLLTFIDQLINLIGAILNFIVGLISAIISIIQQLLGFLFGLIDFILDLINQIISLIQSILDLLKSFGSSLIKVAENAVIIIGAFLIITVGAFIYNRIR